MQNTKDIVRYQIDDDGVGLPVNIKNESVWLSRNTMAKLFDRDVKTIGKHIQNALHEELEGDAVVAKFATTAADGKIYQTEHYNLDVIISVGYRVKSRRGVEFRRWANDVLKRYIINGYTVNDTRIRQLGEVLRVLKRATHDPDAQKMLRFWRDHRLAV